MDKRKNKQSKIQTWWETSSANSMIGAARTPLWIQFNAAHLHIKCQMHDGKLMMIHQNKLNLTNTSLLPDTRV